MRKLNKNQRYLQTLGPLPAIGRHSKGERNLHPYDSLVDGLTAKGVRESSRGLNGHPAQYAYSNLSDRTEFPTRVLSRSGKARIVKPMK